MTSPTPTQRLTAEVLAWRGTTARIGARDEYAFRAGARELGHLHGDRVAHFAFPRQLGQQLRDAGRVGPHPVNPHSPKLAAHRIETEHDVDDILALLRLNYERDHAVADDEAAVHALVAALDDAQSDVERFTALLVDDVRIVNVAGIRVQGREPLRALMTTALAGDLAHVTTRTEVDGLTFVTEDVAIVDAVKHIDDRREGAPERAHRTGALTLTLVRTDTGWRVAALQTTPRFRE
jgi:uncharacterized protein (TIGR02246 family)